MEGSGSREIIGGVLSTTLILSLAVLLLPEQSVAVQVRVTVYCCAHLPGVVTSVYVSLGLPSHTSVAVGVAKLGVAGHSIVDSLGSAEITGGVVSTMLMVCSQLAVPHPFETVQVRTNVPVWQVVLL